MKFQKLQNFLLFGVSLVIETEDGAVSPGLRVWQAGQDLSSFLFFTKHVGQDQLPGSGLNSSCNCLREADVVVELSFSSWGLTRVVSWNIWSSNKKLAMH